MPPRRTVGRIDGISKALLGRLPFCAGIDRLDVPTELIAAVIVAENQINRGVADTIQDILFDGLVKYHDDKWWSAWAERSFQLTNEAETTRLVSNKWPADVVATGFVFSIGPAQITPRTALRACASLSNSPATCVGGVRHLVKSLLSDRGAVELAAVVLRAEATWHLEISGVDPSRDLALWATLYNAGGDYYRNARANGPNHFGTWVAEHASIIGKTIGCR